MARESHWPRLSQGTVIEAEVEAHLFGIRLLTLKAEITALPARPTMAAGSLAAIAADLRAAHDQMPEVTRTEAIASSRAGR